MVSNEGRCPGVAASQPGLCSVFSNKMAVQRKFIDKGLLKNVIRHTDAHNKVPANYVFDRLNIIPTKTCLSD